MKLSEIPLQRWQVKFLLPTLGLIAAYIGGSYVVFTTVLTGEAPSRFMSLVKPCAAGLICGGAAMVGLVYALGEKAKHVSVLRILSFWTATGLSLYVFDWVLQNAVGWELSPVLAHLGLLSAGVFAAWVDEPM